MYERPMGEPDLFTLLERLRAKQLRVIADAEEKLTAQGERIPLKVKTGENWETWILRQSVPLGDVWTNDETRYFEEKLLKPVIRFAKGWPWSATPPASRTDMDAIMGVAVSDLFDWLRSYKSWHGNLAEADASEERESTLVTRMIHWFKYKRLDEGERLNRKPDWKETSPDIGFVEEGEDAVRVPVEVGAPEPIDDTDGWEYLLRRWLDLLAAEDGEPRAEPERVFTEDEVRRGSRPHFASLFFEWCLWPRLPLYESKPVTLANYVQWSQLAYGAWRNFGNRRVAEAVRGLNRTTRLPEGVGVLFQRFCKERIDEGEITWEELSAGFIPFLHVKYFHWLPEFVDARIFIQDAGIQPASESTFSETPVL